MYIFPGTVFCPATLPVVSVTREKARTEKQSHAQDVASAIYQWNAIWSERVVVLWQPAPNVGDTKTKLTVRTPAGGSVRDDYPLCKSLAH